MYILVLLRWLPACLHGHHRPQANTYAGGEAYPSTQRINLGTESSGPSGRFNVTLVHDAYSVPDKFVVNFNGVDYSTGYRGDTSYQSQLDAALAARGAPPEAIVGPGSGTLTFEKTSAVDFATVSVYAPVSGTGWTYTLNCPSRPSSHHLVNRHQHRRRIRSSACGAGGGRAAADTMIYWRPLVVACHCFFLIVCCGGVLLAEQQEATGQPTRHRHQPLRLLQPPPPPFTSSTNQPTNQ